MSSTTLDFESRKLDTNWAIYGCFTRGFVEPNSPGWCEIFWVFDLVAIRIWENSESKSCSGQIILSRMGEISEFWHQDLKLWSLDVEPNFWLERKN